MSDLSGWAWGIDCGALRAGLGCVDLATGAFAVDTVTWRTRSMQVGKSVQIAYPELLAIFRHHHHHHPPATISFEIPMGRHSNPILLMHTGVIVLAAAQVTQLEPWRTSVTQWKKVISGSGSMTREALLPWGERVGVPFPFSQDYDALAGLAVAASAAQTFGLDLARLHPTP